MNSIQHLIEIALKEDIGPGDITTDNLIDPQLKGKGIIIAKEPLVVAGLNVAKQVFQSLDSEVIFRSEFNDGDFAKKGDALANVKGRLRGLLSGERTALNFLQHLSGISTLVRSGWRVLEKYAVRVGGAYNHRTGLYDGVLIKDNHIAAFGGVKKAIDHIRTQISHLLKIEVEVSNLNQVKQALEANADVIMLDNMTIKQIKEATVFIDKRAVVELSGGITKDDLKSLADTGVDIISVGALTHSARCVDISMQINPNL
jgi:nicotinate-nucleotide pyrophosphorylase (carboxylating)